MLKPIDTPTTEGIYFYKRPGWQFADRAHVVTADRGNGYELCIRWKVGTLPEELKGCPEDAEWFQPVAQDCEGNEVKVWDTLRPKSMTDPRTAQTVTIVDVCGSDRELCFTLQKESRIQIGEDRDYLFNEQSLRNSAWVKVGA